ncbi:MAG TPA: glycosyl hydrolase family 18 protein [Xanthobacteraceae bacterium]|jgi:hypothetical protein
MLALLAYVGAQPNGQPAPDLTTVPIPPDSASTGGFRFVLAFAKDDGTGNFSPGWDPSITPDVVAQLKQNNGSISFWASLGGDANYGGTWTAPSDQQAWISNATNSLVNLINTYQLNGLDIDYEAGTDDPTFVSVMSQVLLNVAEQFIGDYGHSYLDFSYSPFSQTATDYQNLYQAFASNVFITYQAYDGEYSDVPGYMTLYSQLAQAYGYGQLGLGICSSTSAPRGLQPPDIYTALSNLQGQGVQVASIFCLEDSANNGYPIERTLLSEFAKKGAAPPHRAA